MNGKAQMFCGWSGIILIALLIIGMGPAAHLSLRPSPMITSADITVALNIAMLVGITIIAISTDKRERPASTRLLAYYFIVTGLSSILMGMIGSAEYGWSASHGLFGWVVPMALVAPWGFLISIFLIARPGLRSKEKRCGRAPAWNASVRCHGNADMTWYAERSGR